MNGVPHALDLPRPVLLIIGIVVFFITLILTGFFTKMGERMYEVMESIFAGTGGSKDQSPYPVSTITKVKNRREFLDSLLLTAIVLVMLAFIAVGLVFVILAGLFGVAGSVRSFVHPSPFAGVVAAGGLAPSLGWLNIVYVGSYFLICAAAGVSVAILLNEFLKLVLANRAAKLMREYTPELKIELVPHGNQSSPDVFPARLALPNLDYEVSLRVPTAMASLMRHNLTNPSPLAQMNLDDASRTEALLDLLLNSEYSLEEIRQLVRAKPEDEPSELPDVLRSDSEDAEVQEDT